MKILVIGDIHGKLGAAASLVNRLEDTGSGPIAAVLQVGDMGLYSGGWMDKTMQKRIKKYGIKDLGDAADYLRGEKTFPVPLYFVPGDHDSFDLMFGRAGYT